MTNQTPHEQLSQAAIAIVKDDSDADLDCIIVDHLTPLADRCTAAERELAEEQAREQRLEDVARKYGIASEAFIEQNESICWEPKSIVVSAAEPPWLPASQWNTRFDCDDAILQAVAAYEKEGGK